MSSHITRKASFAFVAFAAISLVGCTDDTETKIDDPFVVDATNCRSAAECAPVREKVTSEKFDVLAAGPLDQLKPFLRDVPKGADLHNHLTGAVYAETLLEWAAEDGDCIDTSTHRAVFPNQCSATAIAVPEPGTSFYDEIVRAWSMKDFVPTPQESGRDHFFSTFGKLGLVAGFHKDDSLADIAIRAESENLYYIETMFNMGREVGDLSADLWSGSLEQADIAGHYQDLVSSPAFLQSLAQDVDSINRIQANYRESLGCDQDGAPTTCSVGIRFIAQVSRTGAPDKVFGQLVAAFEIASRTQWVVGASLSSPEDHPTSISDYELHMQMLDFLHGEYTLTNKSPLQISLHAGELTEEFLPPGSNANTFHIRQAVEIGHASRIGHGIDVFSETDPEGLFGTLRDMGVLIETCMSSNVQILEVSGEPHPVDDYIERAVPVALATDDQGVSRSSLAGEYLLAVLDQALTYLELKATARASLQHSFIPGERLWTSVNDGQVIAACEPDEGNAVGGIPSVSCEAFLATSKKAATQWALEARFLVFEEQQSVNAAAD